VNPGPLLTLLERSLKWTAWEEVIRSHGIEIDRPRGSLHPRYPGIIYPIDYGFVRGTLGTDGDEADVFVGAAGSGLIAAIVTTDFRRGDRECKFLYNCTASEVYLVNGFINFDRRLMTGTLLMREPMDRLMAGSSAG